MDDSQTLFTLLLALLAVAVLLRTVVSLLALRRWSAQLRAQSAALEARAQTLPHTLAGLRTDMVVTRVQIEQYRLALVSTDARMAEARSRMTELRGWLDARQQVLASARDQTGRIRSWWGWIKAALAVRRVVAG